MLVGRQERQCHRHHPRPRERVFSIVRSYFTDMSVNQTSMEWGIINYDSKSEVFLEPGDSSSIIADIRGRIVLVASPAHQGQRVPQRAPQRSRLVDRTKQSESHNKISANNCNDCQASSLFCVWTAWP